MYIRYLYIFFILLVLSSCNMNNITITEETIYDTVVSTIYDKINDADIDSSSLDQLCIECSGRNNSSHECIIFCVNMSIKCVFFCTNSLISDFYLNNKNVCKNNELYNNIDVDKASDSFCYIDNVIYSEKLSISNSCKSYCNENKNLCLKTCL